MRRCLAGPGASYKTTFTIVTVLGLTSFRASVADDRPPAAIRPDSTANVQFRPAEAVETIGDPARIRPIAQPVNAIPTLRLSTRRGILPSDEPAPAGTGGTAGICPGPLTATHSDAEFNGGSFIIQAGFAEDETAAVSFTLDAADFPIRIESVECIFAQQGAIVPTETRWSVLVWDGLPSSGILVGSFSSDDVILPHLRMPAGTHGTNIQVIVDPSDPEPIFVNNELGTNTFSVGFRVDRHNNQTQNPCVISPPANQNAFPTVDAGGLNNSTGNWLYAINCGPLGCPNDWHRFSQLGLCRPSGDWVIRARYTCTPQVLVGACCEAADSCLENIESGICADIGGTFMGDATACESVSCPEAVGACCLGPTCLSNVTAPTCAAGAGSYVGNSTSCTDSPCDAGACCMSDGGCENLIAVSCASGGGVFQGRTTDCGSANCPQPTGACCVGTVCFPGQTQTTCQAVGQWNGAGTVCGPGACVPDPCDFGAISAASPPSGTVDARQPHPINDNSAGARQGIGRAAEPIRITLGISGVGIGCFGLCETAVDSILGPNRIESVTEVTMGNYEIRLGRPITAGAVTTISYTGGGMVTYTSHPGNVNGDTAAGPTDILRLIDHLNGVTPAPHGLFSVDADHSGAAGALDILRTIDLLNGAGLYDPWNGTSLPTNSTCP